MAEDRSPHIIDTILSSALAMATKLVAEAHAARKLVMENPGRAVALIAADHGRCRTRLAKLVGLSCLAPDIVTAIVEGRQPAKLTTKMLTTLDLPLCWREQRTALGF